MLKSKYFWLSLALIPHFASAFSWQDLWFNKNQQGQHLLKANKPREAAEQFQDDKWKGVAYYKDKQFDKAYTEFQNDKSSLGYYNQGNALANMQKYQEAIAAYEESLKLDKNNQDAKHNIEVLKKLQQQQQQKDKQNDKSDSKQNQDQKNHKSDSNQKNDQQKSDNKNQQNQDKNSSNNQNSERNDGKQNQQQSQQNKSNSDNKPSNNQQQNQANQPKDQQKNDSAANDVNQQNKAKADPSKQSKLNNQQTDQNGNKNTQASSSQLSPEQQRQQQEMQAVLSQIPDDPGGLLRNKFIRDYQKEQNGGNND